VDQPVPGSVGAPRAFSGESDEIRMSSTANSTAALAAMIFGSCIFNAPRSKESEVVALRREQSAALYSSSIKANFARLMASMYAAPGTPKILVSQKDAGG
jgi:hypothetical protein